MTYLYWPANTVITTAGDDTIWHFQVRDKSGAPVNIAGWSFGFWAVDQYDSENIISITGTFAITTAVLGLAYFTVTRASTLTMGGKVFRASLWRTNSGSQKEIASGTWKIMRTNRP